ncbi:hypothetical protein [Kineococcus esterisolvens]
MSIADIDAELSTLVQRKHRTTLRAAREDIEGRIAELIDRRLEVAA